MIDIIYKVDPKILANQCAKGGISDFDECLELLDVLGVVFQYMQFDREASNREKEALMNVIKQLKKEA